MYFFYHDSPRSAHNLASPVCGFGGARSCSRRATTGVAGVGGGHLGARELGEPGESLASSLGHSRSVRPSWPADEYNVALEAALEAALDAPLSLAAGMRRSDQSNPPIFFWVRFSLTAGLFYPASAPARAEN